MLDVSDGLAGDAGHLAAASGVEVRIEAGRVPVHGAVGGAERVELALRGGEEYELLVALPPTFGDPEARGCQLSLQLPSRGREVFRRLEAEGFVGDFRDQRRTARVSREPADHRARAPPDRLSARLPWPFRLRITSGIFGCAFSEP